LLSPRNETDVQIAPAPQTSQAKKSAPRMLDAGYLILDEELASKFAQNIINYMVLLYTT
jgi:hypothetical protein